MKKLFFVTGNAHKLKEAREILGEVDNIEIDLPEIQNMDPKKIVEHKLKEAAKSGKDNIFVEDVSFHMECLNGFPGPLIKWLFISVGRRGLYELCKKFDNFNATAVAHIGLLCNGKITHFEGSVKGKVVEPRVENGFGFDPVFVPDGHEKAYSEMEQSEKNKISHRRLALEEMKKYLEKVRI